MLEKLVRKLLINRKQKGSENDSLSSALKDGLCYDDMDTILQNSIDNLPKKILFSLSQAITKITKIYHDSNK
jgi:hypothetical protein